MKSHIAGSSLTSRASIEDADKTRKNHEAEVGYQENIRRSDELRCEINSTINHDVKLMLALRCIELMTGEEEFERRNLNE